MVVCLGGPSSLPSEGALVPKGADCLGEDMGDYESRSHGFKMEGHGMSAMQEKKQKEQEAKAVAREGSGDTKVVSQESEEEAPGDGDEAEPTDENVKEPSEDEEDADGPNMCAGCLAHPLA